MLTSYAILEALESHTDMIVETLNEGEKRQFIKLLLNIEQADDKVMREDAVDVLDDFCRSFSAMDEMLNNMDELYRGGYRGKPNFELTEEEEKIRLYANRLIKATEESLEQEGTSKENSNEDD